MPTAWTGIVVKKIEKKSYNFFVTNEEKRIDSFLKYQGFAIDK
jgi:hypothetical protein